MSERNERGGLPQGYSLRRFMDNYDRPSALGLIIQKSDEISVLIESLKADNELDPKTGLLNSVVFNKRVKQRIESARLDEHKVEDDRRKQKTGFCLIIADFDDFKKLNDVLGYQAADNICLIPSADIMRESASRSGDLIAAEVSRFGGEEFIVFLEGTDLEGAITVAQRMKTEMNGICFETPAGPQNLGVSMGIVSFGFDDSYESVFDATNDALNIAKGRGKNCIVATQYEATDCTINP